MRTRLATGLLAAAVLLAVVIGARQSLARLAIAAAGAATGYSIQIGALHVGGGRAVFDDVRVIREREPLLDADRIEIAYNLRDLFPGSRHRYGLLGVVVQHPTITVVRHRDGSFNFTIPRGGGVPQAPRPNPVPLRLSLRIRDGRLVLREPLAYDQSAKELQAVRLTLDGSIDTAEVTHYRLEGAFAAERPERFTVVGRVDAPAGYAIHHARAAEFPLRALANYFADTREVRNSQGDGSQLGCATLFARRAAARSGGLRRKSHAGRYGWNVGDACLGRAGRTLFRPSPSR